MERINIITALSCEARPFIDAYHLKKYAEPSRFDVYRNHSGNIHLLVSGIGKINAAAGVAYLQHFNDDMAHAVYLNIGIAGSQSATIGEMYWIDKIHDQATQKYFYPSLVLKSKLSTVVLTTLDQPQDHHGKGLIDMEGSGFYQAASKFVCQEQVALLKVVSDNIWHTKENITRIKVIELIHCQMSVIREFIDKLAALSYQEAELTRKLPIVDELIARHHFTQYQQNELFHLIKRYLLKYTESDLSHLVENKKSATDMIKSLRKSIRYAPLTACEQTEKI